LNINFPISASSYNIWGI